MNVTVENATAPIAELPDSTPLRGDHAALEERWRRDGALFFRDAIDTWAIAKVRDEYMARLKEVGVIDEDADRPKWNGRNRLDGGRMRTMEDAVWRELVADPSFDAVVRDVLGGKAPVWVPIVVHRAAPPGAVPGETFATRHQDGIYNYGIDFVTCWVPLMDIGDEVGGLAIAPGTHAGSLYPPDVFATPGKRVGIPAGTIPDAAWRRPDYKAGDLLMFHSMTAHAGLPNRSDSLRLSMDIRFLPRTGAIPVVGRLTRVDDAHLELRTEAGHDVSVTVGEETIVRGPKGHPVVGDDRAGILFPGAEVIVVPDDAGSAKLIRSSSRKFLDLPADWYDTFPAGWVR